LDILAAVIAADVVKSKYPDFIFKVIELSAQLRLKCTLAEKSGWQTVDYGLPRKPVRQH
jgi:hypothetical protein